MNKETTWTVESKFTITSIKRLSGYLAAMVRKEQFKIFKLLLAPTKHSKVVDVGVASSEDIKGVNQFEKLYGYPNKLTLLTIEDSKKLRDKYPGCHVVKIVAGKRLPFEDKTFDIAVSWATLEHVGGYNQQESFINELLRISKKIFITTPDRGAVYEPHSGMFLLHWLPLRWFRKICNLSNKKFWSVEDNLNPLFVSDLRKMQLKGKVKIKIFRMFYFIPTHIIIFT